MKNIFGREVMPTVSRRQFRPMHEVGGAEDILQYEYQRSGTVLAENAPPRPARNSIEFRERFSALEESLRADLEYKKSVFETTQLEYDLRQYSAARLRHTNLVCGDD